MSPAGQTQIRSKMTCNNPWNTDNCYDGLLRGVNASRTSAVTTVSDLVEYRPGTVECTGTGVVPTWSSTEVAQLLQLSTSPSTSATREAYRRPWSISSSSFLILTLSSLNSGKKRIFNLFHKTSVTWFVKGYSNGLHRKVTEICNGD